MPCEDEFYKHGPMAVVVDQVVKRKSKFSLLESGQSGFVPEHTLIERASELKDANRKSFRQPGKKKPRETAYFFENARALALIAKEKAKSAKDDVIAVLFRDSDGTAAAAAVCGADKHDSMLAGFEHEQFLRGVPMIPKPKSEAWVICALKKNPYSGCDALEERSGNDNSPNSLKRELKQLYGHSPSREELCEMVPNREIDIDKIRMPSFKAFRDRLEQVLQDS